MVKQFLGISLICLTASLNSFAAQIKGNINIQDEWMPVVYLSLIQSFDDLNTASFHFLIAEATIDEQGHFQFDSLSLPINDHLYRLHICKKNDPISTIIIGGQEQNHLHFLMNDKSNLNINIHSFYDFDISGHSGNKTLQFLFDQKKELNAPLNIPSEQNRLSHRNRILNNYVSITDSAESVINQLLAVHFIDESFGSNEHIELFERLDQSLTQLADSSPYFKNFQNQLEFAKFSSQSQAKATQPNWFVPIAVLISLLLILSYLLINRNKKPVERTASLLSLQERKVYDLLQAGKSNKEISSVLHIEVSTVKSHVYKIYSKLGIKSRKELVN